MSKNLTRKGLALGAVVALGSTLFAGAPAQAASVLFAPTTGTGNTLVAGETFSLTASLSSDLPAGNSTQLKFRVVNTTGVAATMTVNRQTLTTSNDVDYAVTGSTAEGNVWASAPAAGDAQVFGLGDANGVSVATNPTSIEIVSPAATTSSFAVTAFLDANNNGTVDTGELTAAQTVNFVKIADSGVAVTFTKPVQYSTALSAKVTFAADVNVDQLSDANYKVGFGLYGVSGALSATGTAGSSAIGSNLTAVTDVVARNGYATETATALAAPAAGATYSAQVYYSATGASHAAVGTEALQVVAATTAADATPLVVAPAVGDDIAADTASGLAWSGSTATATNGVYRIRTGVKSTSVSATVKKTPTGTTVSSTSGVAVGAGVEVNVFVTAANEATPAGSTTKDTLTVAGVTVVTSGASANVSASTPIAKVTTDATGKVTVPVTSSLGTAADSLTIVLQVVDAVSTAKGQVQLNWTAATLVAPKALYTGNATPTVVKGSAVSLKYVLTDSYGALYTGSAYQLLFTAPGINSTTVNATPVNVYAPFVNGIATVSFTDNALAAGTNSATYKILKNVNGAWIEPTNAAPDAALYSANSGSGVSASYNVVASAAVASAVSATATNSSTATNSATAKAALDVDGKYVAGDPRSAANTVVVPEPTATSVVKIAGVVTDAAGVGVAGAQVTVALKGAQFASAAFGNANAVYALDTITVNASTSGEYEVYLATHTAGTNSVVVTSGSATKTVSVYVASAAATSGTTISIDAPATVVPGKTLTFTGKLTDKYGNAVATDTAVADFKVVYAGPGFAAQTLPVETDASGAFTVSIVTGVADSGSAVLTATYGGSKGAIDATVTGATADITKSATVSIAAPVVVVPEVKTTIVGVTKAIRVRVENAKGEEVEIVVNGRTVAVATAGTNSKLWVLKSTKGKKSVKVYVDGDLVAVKTVTVK